MRKKYIFLLALALFVPSLLLATSLSIFQKDLKLGDERLDVKIAQMVLNLDPQTRVSLSGAGSLGKESIYFGERTRQAVIKFQKKYGILGENGRIGAKTRAKLDQVLAKLLNLAPASSVAPTKPVTSQTNSSNQNIASTAKPVTARPVITSISPSSGGNNTTITIKGKNFLPSGNTVWSSFADEKMNISSSDGETLLYSVYLPSEFYTDEETGEIGSFVMPMDIWVENKNGLSNILKYEIRL